MFTSDYFIILIECVLLVQDFFFLGENDMIKLFTICGIPYPCICNSIILKTSTVGLLKNLHQSTEAWNFIENDENFIRLRF